MFRYDFLLPFISFGWAKEGFSRAFIMGILDGHIADFRQRRVVSGSPHEQPTRWVDDIMIFHSPWRTIDSHVRGTFLYSNTKTYIARFQVFKLPVPARYI
jgi:hypothetical protein